jgi:protease I
MAKVAFIVDELYEDSEFRVPYNRVKEAGHEAVIVGLAAGKTIEARRE